MIFAWDTHLRIKFVHVESDLRVHVDFAFIFVLDGLPIKSLQQLRGTVMYEASTLISFLFFMANLHCIIAWP